MSQTTSIRHGVHANTDIRKWHVDIITKTRKNVQDHATENATPHRTNKEKIQIKKQEEAADETEDETKKHEEEEKKRVTDKETEEGSNHNSNNDQDSDVSFPEGNDEAIDTTEKEEEWIEFVKRSTKEAEEYMKKMKIPCWIETHRILKWRMARRIALLPKEIWTSKIFDWHPGLDNKIKTRRLVGRPKRRWEDDITEFIRPGETTGETRKGNKCDFMNNNSWMTEAKKTQRMERKRRTYQKQIGSKLYGSMCKNNNQECFALAHLPTDLGKCKKTCSNGVIGRLLFCMILWACMSIAKHSLNDDGSNALMTECGHGVLDACLSSNPKYKRNYETCIHRPSVPTTYRRIVPELIPEPDREFFFDPQITADYVPQQDPDAFHCDDKG